MKFWRVLLGHLASLIHLVLGGRLRLRAIQPALSSQWDSLDEFTMVEWDDSLQADLRWWCDEVRLEEGVSLESHRPDLMFWSDAFDQGWEATMSDQFRSGLWSEEEALYFINAKELLAVEKGLLSLLSLLRGCSVAVFCNNTTALSYLRHQGGGVGGGGEVSLAQLDCPVDP